MIAIIHDNRVYALTIGQYTPTSPLGFKGKSIYLGSNEYPINPLEVMLASGASFIAKGYPVTIERFKGLIKDTIEHKGFSFIDILQVCATCNRLYDFYNKHVYEVKDNGSGGFEQALKIIRSGVTATIGKSRYLSEDFTIMTCHIRSVIPKIRTKTSGHKFKIGKTVRKVGLRNEIVKVSDFEKGVNNG